MQTYRVYYFDSIGVEPYDCDYLSNNELICLALTADKVAGTDYYRVVLGDNEGMLYTVEEC